MKTPKFNLILNTIEPGKVRKTTVVTRLAPWLVAVLASGIVTLQAQPIFVPNHSFETATAPTTIPYVNVIVEKWEKPPEPAYYDAAIGTPFGIPWIGTAGVFYDTNPYLNHDGIQGGYILGFPQVALFQDYNSTPTHDFNVTYEIGNAYNLTIGIFGKPTLAPGSTLEVSLYYLDDLDSQVTVESTTLTYSAEAFPVGPPWNLIDFQVNVPVVQAGDAWAGKHLGIKLEATNPLELSTGGNWDFDNVRLAAVPEPSSLTFLALGFGGMLLTRARSRRL